jgi:hypothetical protein
MENYIEDILKQLIQDAKEIKPIDDFEKGKLFGYYFSISIILSQAASFGVLDKLPKNLRDFSPESLLVETTD